MSSLLSLSLLTALTLTATAGAPETPHEKIYTFGKGTRTLLYYPERHLVISSDCLDKSTGQLSCKALTAFRRSTLNGVHLPPGGADPGAVICVQRFEGRILVGRNDYGAESAFCRLSDGTLVSTGSLDFASRYQAR